MKTFIEINFLQEFQYLKQIQEDEITICLELSYYPPSIISPIFDAIQELVESQKKLEIIVQSVDHNFDDDEIMVFSSLESGLIAMHVPLYFDGGHKDYYSLDELIKMDTFLDKIINKLKESSLSPLEKYLYVYRYLINHQYKQEPDEENAYLSRDLISIVNGDYIVCEGYSKLMEYLLDNLGIKSFKQTLSVSFRNHMNNLVYIYDQKYQVNGLYYADSCWDASGKYLTFCLLPLSDVPTILTNIVIFSDCLPFYRVRNYKMLLDNALIESLWDSPVPFTDLIKKHHLEDKVKDCYSLGAKAFLKRRNTAIEQLINIFEDMDVDKELYYPFDTLPYGTSLPFLLAMLILSKDNETLVRHQIQEAIRFRELDLDKLEMRERPYFKGEVIMNQSRGIEDLYNYLKAIKAFSYETIDLSYKSLVKTIYYEAGANYPISFCLDTLLILQQSLVLPILEKAAHLYPLGKPISVETFKTALKESFKVDDDYNQEKADAYVNDIINRTIVESKRCFYEAENAFYQAPLPEDKEVDTSEDFTKKLKY